MPRRRRIVSTVMTGGPGTILGVDVGGTKTHVAAYDHDLNQLAELRVPTTNGSPDLVAGLVLDAVADLAARLGDRTITTIGIGVPGLVDRQTGSVRQAVNLGIGDEPLDLVARLTEAHHVPCYLDNDVNVAALGAYRIMRADDHFTDLAYLSIGTGIASGVILDGRLHRGQRGVAGEIGHFPVSPGGPECECGLRGCLEVVASGSAIGRLWPTTGPISPAESLIAQAGRGHEPAVAVLEPIADHLAQAVYLLVIAYDVDRIVIGGGVADVGEPLLATIDDALGRLEARSGFVRSLELRHRVLLKPPGPVGAIGAATLAHPDARR